MGPALPGIAYVVSKANVPVVPVGIVGSTEDFLRKAFLGARPTLEMRIGNPIFLPAINAKGEERRAALKQNTDLIMLKIASLLPPEYWGVYGNRDFHFAETA
jgi:1-acyl-sn-glycerol-3-phosphate acyltransferase